MKKLLVPFFTAMLLVGCSGDDDQLSAEELQELDETEDIEKLIDTNERLVKQLEQYSGQAETLQEQIDELQEENDRLKNDILTYKTQAYDTEALKDEELALREEIDAISLNFFEAMHKRDHEQLSLLTSDHVETDEENDVIHVRSDKEVIGSFHYMSLNVSELDFLQQTAFEYDSENDHCSVLYTLHSFEHEENDLIRVVELEFEKEDGTWKVSSIQNRM
ncbi:hypothetical protein [Alteribacter keqinensis]|uniref:Uncharacterized protein n=1 Tax=Alteribacter keqinensis TaxID=2483800 RepID=A0A3M7TX12_9BACI|nr:hypothetical protein [Alteribacter keqinensis]RNA70116.1 hypothetical protein EBO34_09365 [Alteribacter keqinensis]